MYNAGTGLIEVSTIPRGDRAAAMAVLRTEVPAWNAAASAYVSNPNFYCAEDGVLFTVESQVNDGIENGKCGLQELFLGDIGLGLSPVADV